MENFLDYVPNERFLYDL